MRYLLDTNICIYAMKKLPVVRARFTSINRDQLFIASITLAELKYGVAKSIHQDKNEKILDDLVERVTLINFDALAAAHHGSIRVSLEKQGIPIGSNDLLIASIAKCADLTSITNNEREFARVAGLKIENWVK